MKSVFFLTCFLPKSSSQEFSDIFPVWSVKSHLFDILFSSEVVKTSFCFGIFPPLKCQITFFRQFTFSLWSHQVIFPRLFFLWSRGDVWDESPGFPLFDFYLDGKRILLFALISSRTSVNSGLSADRSIGRLWSQAVGRSPWIEGQVIYFFSGINSPILGDHLASWEWRPEGPSTYIWRFRVGAGVLALGNFRVPRLASSSIVWVSPRRVYLRVPCYIFGCIFYLVGWDNDILIIFGSGSGVFVVYERVYCTWDILSTRFFDLS